jgi:hypothetical protein
MDRLTALLLRLTPDERIELAREVAARVASMEDADIEAEWLRALENRFGHEPEQLPLWQSEPDARG